MAGTPSMDLPSRAAASPSGRVAVRLAAACDALRAIAPVVAVFDRTGPVAVDAPEAVGNIDGPTIDLPDHVGLPPLVNAHAHLDLTCVGPIAFNGTFADWAGEVRARRPATPDAVASAVRAGAERAVAGGTGFIGDIAGNFGLAALEALRAAAPGLGLEGVSYVEVFGIGAAGGRGLDFLRGLRERVAADGGGIRLGVSPHATYSCDDAVYAAAAALGLPVATHLAETLDELRFVQDGSGPFAELLKAVGAWTPELRGWQAHPVERIQPIVRGKGAALVHLNYLSDASLALLASDARRERPSVAVYCPRASAYFGHPAHGHAPHRYRELLAAGVPVALGTDSAGVLGDAPTISVLDEVRLLHGRDRTDPMQLLAMATVHGAQALGLDRARVLLPTATRREATGMIAVPAGRRGGGSARELLGAAFEGAASAQWLWGGAQQPQG